MILKGQRGITADAAPRLSRYFGTTPQLWLNLQKTFELRTMELESGQDIADRVQPKERWRSWIQSWSRTVKDVSCAASGQVPDPNFACCCVKCTVLSPLSVRYAGFRPGSQ